MDCLHFRQRWLGSTGSRAEARVLAAKRGGIFGAVAAKQHWQHGPRAAHEQEAATRERRPPLAGVQELPHFFAEPNFTLPPQRRAHALGRLSRAVHGGLRPALPFAHGVALEALVEQQGVPLKDATGKAAASER